MDIKKRQEAPSDLKEQSIQTKLKMIAETIRKYLCPKETLQTP